MNIFKKVSFAKQSETRDSSWRLLSPSDNKNAKKMWQAQEFSLCEFHTCCKKRGGLFMGHEFCQIVKMSSQSPAYLASRMIIEEKRLVDQWKYDFNYPVQGQWFSNSSTLASSMNNCQKVFFNLMFASLRSSFRDERVFLPFLLALSEVTC